VTEPPTLRIEDEGPVRIAHVGGELEVSSVGPVRERMLAAVENHDAGLVIDLSDASYVDSAGVNLLFEVAERLALRQLSFAIVCPEGGVVERVLVLVNLAAVAQVHRSVDDAVRAVLSAE
jgi:anti-anti-sigma factor